MTRAEALALVQRLLDAAGSRDVDAVMACYADDPTAVSPVFGHVRGRAAVAATWQRLFDTFLDISLDVTDILVDGDRVAALSTLETTDQIGWFGQRPTGARIQYRLVLLLTTSAGRIVRDERIYDSSGVVERLEKARLDRELRTAAEMQRVLLSRTEYRTAFSESYARSLPCRAIGGDFFDFIDLADGSVGLLIGDVAGKGPPAALLGAHILGIFSTLARNGGGPAATVARVNAEIMRRPLSARYATLVYAELSSDGKLVYTNAGHPPPVVAGAGAIQGLSVGGPVVGVFGDAAFEQAEIALAPGDRLLMVTDGVTEAHNSGDEDFGEARLLEFARQSCAAQAGTVLDRLFQHIAAFAGGAEFVDDITAAITVFNER